MNDLDLYLEVVLRSCQPLRHIRRWISWKPIADRGLVPEDHQIGNSLWGIQWLRDQWCHVTPDHNSLRAHYLENSWRCYSATVARLPTFSSDRFYLLHCPLMPQEH